MFPTLDDKDLMIMDRNDYRKNEPEYGDIVVFTQDDMYLIKRLIGKPGDKISFRNGQVYRNEKLLNEDYLAESMTEPGDDIVLDEDEYYVLGDNREVSKDSRYFGPVNRRDILGKTVYRVFPNPKDF